MTGLFVFIFGLFIGSFLNCTVYRLENSKSFLKGRSFCPNCKQTLSWLDLVPIFSFLFLKGKCRYCQKRISIQYPLVELLTGLLFLLIWLLASDIVFWFIISCFLIIIFIYDLKHFIIPDRVLFPAIIIALGYIFVFKYDLLAEHILSAIGASAFFLFIVLVSRGRGMGVGDVKLAILMGLLLGFPDIIVSLFFAFLIGAIIGVGLILLKKKTLKSEVPFGPFLILGIYIALFFGDKIVNWYFTLFL